MGPLHLQKNRNPKTNADATQNVSWLINEKPRAAAFVSAVGNILINTSKKGSFVQESQFRIPIWDIVNFHCKLRIPQFALKAH